MGTPKGLAVAVAEGIPTPRLTPTERWRPRFRPTEGTTEPRKESWPTNGLLWLLTSGPFAAAGSRFLWFLSFGDAKERNVLRGTTGYQMSLKPVPKALTKKAFEAVAIPARWVALTQHPITHPPSTPTPHPSPDESPNPHPAHPQPGSRLCWRFPHNTA